MKPHLRYRTANILNSLKNFLKKLLDSCAALVSFVVLVV